MLSCLKTSRSGKVGYESHYDPALLEKKAKPTGQLLPGDILFCPENTAVRRGVTS